MHVFITGGTRGIGNGMVKVFLKNAHRVSFTGTSESSITKAESQLQGEFQSFVCDVRKMEQIKAAMMKAVEVFGDIDIWINNAGVGQVDLPLIDMSEEQIKKVVETNVLGTLYGCNIALNQMLKQNHGTIYNLEGLGSIGMVIPKTVVYGSTKRQITYITKGLIKETRKTPIKIGTIQPGMVFTDLLMENMPKNGMRIAEIIGNDVDYTTEIIYQKMVKGRRRIRVMNTMKTMGRFFVSMFHKDKKL